MYLVPFIKKENTQTLRALYMRQDLILGNGSDTILDLNNLSLSLYNERMDRFGTPDPADVFVAVKQMHQLLSKAYRFGIGITSDKTASSYLRFSQGQGFAL